MQITDSCYLSSLSLLRSVLPQFLRPLELPAMPVLPTNYSTHTSYPFCVHSVIPQDIFPYFIPILGYSSQALLASLFPKN